MPPHTCQSPFAKARSVFLVALLFLFSLSRAGAAAQEPREFGCHDGADMWEGLCIRPEPDRRSGYARADHADSESAIIRSVLARRAGRFVVGPYTCRRFEVKVRASGGALYADTDIEHVVALAEAHDSGLAPSQRHAFANDLFNQVLVDSSANRSKGGRDAAEWTPDHNRRWFARRVIDVKLKWGLSVDLAEAEALRGLLAGDDAACTWP